MSEERQKLIREVRQRLESLGRAGLDRIAIPPPTIVAASPAPAPAALPAEAPSPAPAPALASARASSGTLTTGNEDVISAIRPAPPHRPAASAAPRPLPAASLFGEPEMELPPVDPSERPAQLTALAAEVAVCARCPHLAATRTRTVFGDGSPTARLMFIGEAPGAEEDRTGQPFVGRAGVLLTDMITKGMGLARADVYIANILKSRPPENRDPLPDEVAHCLPYLERQIAIIRPEFLCLLGRIAAQNLLDTALSMGRLRGKWYRYRGISTIVTYHPSYLLRNPAAKKDAWEDLQMLMQAMGLKPPGRKKS
jgi:uracil-DNA glycosylase